MNIKAVSSNLPAFSGLELIMSKLIRLGPNVAVNPFNGRTPLHISIDSALEKVVAILIENGANVSSTDSSGRTPLHISAHSGKVH